MIVCCTANSPSNATLITTDRSVSPGVPVSIDLGTTQLPTKPIR